MPACFSKLALLRTRQETWAEYRLFIIKGFHTVFSRVFVQCEFNSKLKMKYYYFNNINKFILFLHTNFMKLRKYERRPKVCTTLFLELFLNVAYTEHPLGYYSILYLLNPMLLNNGGKYSHLSFVINRNANNSHIIANIYFAFSLPCQKLS